MSTPKHDDTELTRHTIMETYTLPALFFRLLFFQFRLPWQYLGPEIIRAGKINSGTIKSGKIKSGHIVVVLLLLVIYVSMSKVEFIILSCSFVPWNNQFNISPIPNLSYCAGAIILPVQWIKIEDEIEKL